MSGSGSSHGPTRLCRSGKGYSDRPEDAAQSVCAAAEDEVAGCLIEDSSGDVPDEICHLGLAVKRAVAAIEAARSLPDEFMLTVQAENLIRQRPGLDYTKTRWQAFDEAGADVIFAPGLKTLDMVHTVCSSVSKPTTRCLAGLPTWLS